MSIQNLLRTFRSSMAPALRQPVRLEDETALYRRRADVALEEERFQDGLVFLAKVLRLNPYDLPARMLVAQTYHYGLAESAKALVSYEKLVAVAGYDESNPYCAAAREAIRELSLEGEPALNCLVDFADTPNQESGGLPQTAAG